ncbi:inositol oxygenase [Octopus bimaculoides]|nr:inositol oxygenase [Octopus bimaculoides]|eukprot:XP_014771482.1 PREDICTED: inositol oxygenase-like [Octopus bimaculoides]
MTAALDSNIMSPFIREKLVYNHDAAKENHSFRNFDKCDSDSQVYNTYKQMHTFQTVDFVKESHGRWTRFDHVEMSIMEALEMLNNLVDESDPDIDLSNSFHAFQTAEGIRKEYPDEDWFQLTGLIHDLGKVMALWGAPQWSVVGDTYPVGCRPAPSVVYADSTFNDNRDFNNPKFNTKLGIYEEHCGLSKVLMSWGHDEYMYQVLKHNTCYLPEEALCVIRYHSFYPWHTCNDYGYLCDNKDQEMLKWVQNFNPFDLYTKSPVIPDVDEIRPHYEKLIEKYIPGKLKW